MPETWITSDTHFSHNKILEYDSRPFKNIEEHDEILIQNWNNHIKENDSIYFLGDFSLCSKEKTLKIFNRLHGKFNGVIRGNHDSGENAFKHKVGWYKDLHHTKINGQKCTLCHYALLTWPKLSKSWCLHGHSHDGLYDDPNTYRLDIGLDATARRQCSVHYTGRIKPEDISKLKPDSYRPFNFDEIREIMSKKQFIQIDHHE